MKIHLAQINPTIGDFTGNVQLIGGQVRAAVAAGAKMAVFPELSVSGYYPKDLLLEPGFMDRAGRAVAQVLSISQQNPGLYIVFGAPSVSDEPGKRLRNSLLLVKDGAVLLQYDKQLLPTYNIFDEYRHFEPGRRPAPVMNIESWRVGFLVCEDCWNLDQYDYITNPVSQLREEGVDVVVTINASPSHVGKRRVRHELVRRISAELDRAWVIYVNQVGGQDELVYDGASFAMSPAGDVVAECDRFCSDGRVVTLLPDNLAERMPDVRDAQDLVPEVFYVDQILLGLKDYMRRCGFREVVVGSSGGIDSAVTLALATLALGSGQVRAVTMPSRFSSEGSVSDSVELCKNLGIRLDTFPIGKIVADAEAQFLDSFAHKGQAVPLAGVALENIQARMRGTTLMAFSNQFGHLLLTTGNKSEVAVGYCTLYGDTNGGLGLIGDLYKMEVYAVAREINRRFGFDVIPAAIIEKAPSAELAPGQKDEDSLPPYPVLDRMLLGLVEFDAEGLEFIRQIEAGADEALKAHLKRVRFLLGRSEYKRRQAPPIIRVRPRAFGAGRQIPLAAKLEV